MMFSINSNILTNDGILKISDLRSSHKLMNPLTLSMVKISAIQTQTLDQSEIIKQFVLVPKNHFAKGAPKVDTLIGRNQVIFARVNDHFSPSPAHEIFSAPKPRIFNDGMTKIVGILTETDMPILVDGMVIMSTGRNTVAKDTNDKPFATAQTAIPQKQAFYN